MKLDKVLMVPLKCFGKIQLDVDKVSGKEHRGKPPHLTIFCVRLEGFRPNASHCSKKHVERSAVYCGFIQKCQKPLYKPKMKNATKPLKYAIAERLRTVDLNIHSPKDLAKPIYGYTSQITAKDVLSKGRIFKTFYM